ncbi:MAG: SCP2 sterol-binding domain-containing protein, partial [Deltaproteobacteria bacterium]|nr:SCP2 sterol-binding domain-containing protein [Deltaproteobacteria bacterium]
GDMLTALQPKKEQPAAASGGGAVKTVSAVFDNMSSGFKADAAEGADVVFQFSISGEGGGDWIVAVKDGTCKVDTGVHAKPNTTIKMAGTDFLTMMSGKMSAMQAYTSGKIKIEGDLMKSQLIEKIFKI